MAKKWSWATPVVTSIVAGAADQQLIQQAGVGNLGGLTPTQTQAGFAGLLAVGGGLMKLLPKRESMWTRIGEGGLIFGAGLLGQSGMHQAQTMVANQQATAAANSGAASSGSTSTTSTTSTSGSTAAAQSVSASDPSYESVG